MSETDNLDLSARTMRTSESSINRSTQVVHNPITGKLKFLIPVEC